MIIIFCYLIVRDNSIEVIESKELLLSIVIRFKNIFFKVLIW